jgi:hypothetical protein
MNSFRNIPDSHFHIRWNEKNVLDWECFDTREEAEAQARELAAWNETLTIEAVSQKRHTRARIASNG